MRRGDIWQVAFESVRGSEATKTRPAVIVSNDRANATAARLGRGFVTVVPMTSNLSSVYPFQVRIDASANGLSTDSRTQAEQIRSIAVQRLTHRMGRIWPQELTALDEALRLHLAL